MSSNPQKIYAFIDSQNLNLAIHDCGWKLDFKKFIIYLKDKYKVREAFLFIGYIAGNELLYTYLQNCRYSLVFKPTLEYKKDSKTFIKGNVDAELVLHCMIHFKEYDKAIIVSGDGDFYCLVEYLAKQNKLSHILVPNENYSGLLRKYNKFIARIDLLKDSLELHKK